MSARARVLALLFASVALASFAVALPAGHGAGTAAGAGDCTVDPSLDSEERAFLTLINNYRVQNGLAPLTLSYGLSRASAWKSKDMAANRYFAHDDLTRTWVDRIRDCGYGYNTWLGENIAAGYTTAQQAFDAWRNSPGHNANMLGANYTTIGIGRYYDASSPYGWYWTTDFGGVSDGFVWASDAPVTLSPVAPQPAGYAPPALGRAARRKAASKHKR
ncbi:MAG TPA: CAP domain-containing protein [Dehalococcoidia bacterium]|nr:CAP domain-containing protein [Dehalococcoidia bacterium]